MVYRIGITGRIGKFGLCFLLWDNHVLPRNLCWEIGNIFGYLRVVGNASTTNLKNKITKLQHKKDKKYDIKNIKIISICYCNNLINFLFAQNGGNLDSTTIRNHNTRTTRRGIKQHWNYAVYGNGSGEKNLNYSVLGIQRDDKLPFKWTWNDGKYISIESNGSDFSKTWIIMTNKKKFQKWKSTDGTNNVQIIELKK